MLVASAMAPAHAFVALHPAPTRQLQCLAPRAGVLQARRTASLCLMMAVPPRPLNPNVPPGSAAARLRLLLKKPGTRVRG
jgi:hypothetical protein